MIVIVGPKHAGKSTAGKALAALMGGTFCDLDCLIEEREGKSPRALYREGPDRFRQAEAAAAASAAAGGQSGGLVLAAGGGLVDNAGALGPLRARPDVTFVYLEVSGETAWRRIEAAGPLPAFLADEIEPHAAHRALHERRAASYRDLADITIDAEEKPPEALAQEIAAAVERRAARHSAP